MSMRCKIVCASLIMVFMLGVHIDHASAATCSEGYITCSNECEQNTEASDAEKLDCANDCLNVQEVCIQKQGKASAESKGISGAKAGGFGLQETAKAADLPNQDRDVPGMIGLIIKAALGLVATIFFALMIYGGFLWMTARGEGEQVGTAKKLIGNAVLGVVVISAAYAITQFVLDSLV